MTALLAHLGLIRPRCPQLWQRNHVKSGEHWQCSRRAGHEGQHRPWLPRHGRWVFVWGKPGWLTAVGILAGTALVASPAWIPMLIMAVTR